MKSPTIIAIGGGKPASTKIIDQEVLSRTKKKKPKLLFVGTASLDNERYQERMKKHYEKLGAHVSFLELYRDRPSTREISKMIAKADAIYVGGGNTLRMMRFWQKIGIDRMLKKAYKKGTVMAGLSAGSICWFHWGNSDSRRFANPDAPLIKVHALNLFPMGLCPHYEDGDRRPELHRMMKRTKGVAIAVDNNAAFEVIGKKARMLRTRKKANVYRVFKRDGIIYEVPLEENKWYSMKDIVNPKIDLS